MGLCIHRATADKDVAGKTAVLRRHGEQTGARLGVDPQRLRSGYEVFISVDDIRVRKLVAVPLDHPLECEPACL